MPDPRQLRASDADRDRVADVLREALAEGRLTPVEHAERVEATYTARTLGDLEPITADLPDAHPGPVRPTAGGPADVPAERRTGRPATAASAAVAIFSEVKRRGPWYVGQHTVACAVFGAVHLDLSDAVLAEHEISIQVTSVFGSVHIEVPEDAVVHVDGLTIFGTSSAPTQPPARPGGPVIRISGFTLFGECEVHRATSRWRDELT